MRKVKKISIFLLSLFLLSSNTSLNDYSFQDKVQVKQKLEPAKSSQLTTESTNGDYSNLDSSFSAIASTDMSYTTSAYYTSKIKNNSAYSYSLSLDKNTAYYCPDDYSINIGLCGTFYVGTFDIVEKKSWWGGVQDADFWSYDNTFVLVKESTLSYNYVVKQTTATDLTSYYYLK